MKLRNFKWLWIIMRFKQDYRKMKLKSLNEIVDDNKDA
jgi:hypothetical protein